MNIKQPEVAIVVAAYHEPVRLVLQGAQERVAARAKLAETVSVPGAFEIPLAVAELLAKPNIDGVVTLGAIERGETGHGQVLAEVVFTKLMDLMVSHGKPIGLGIIGPNATQEQIASRATPIMEESVDAVLGSVNRTR